MTFIELNSASDVDDSATTGWNQTQGRAFDTAPTSRRQRRWRRNKFASVSGATHPEGRLFSRTYLKREENLSDSQRFRTRLFGYFWLAARDSDSLRNAIAQHVRMELGVVVPSSYGYDFEAFFSKASIRDVLDTITIVFAALNSTPHRSREANEWRDSVSRAVAEEGLLYTIDSKCGVHRAIDAEFDHNRKSTIRALTDPRYAGVAAAVEAAFKKLEQPHPDRKGALRDMFESAEILFKLITRSGANLSSSGSKKHLQPIVARMYSKDGPTASTAGRALSSFESWADAAHPFRHGQETEIPLDLPDELAILLLSQGASFVRWLADVDRATATTSK